MRFADKPEMTMKANELKTASNAGTLAKLRCRAVGAPRVKFTWERDEVNLSSVTDKYIVEEKKVNIKKIVCIYYSYVRSI